MENARNAQANTAATESCCAPAAKSGWPSSRNLLIGAAGVGGAAAMFFGWDWLVAAGVASVIVALAPCLAMCALGLCASRMGKRDAGSSAQTIGPKEAQLPAAETAANARPTTQVMANAQSAAETVTNVQPKALERAESA